MSARPTPTVTAFQAFADPLRLRILLLLRRREMCVCDLVEVLRVPQPTASRHLARLRKAGLVKVRKQGFWTFYSLSLARDGFHRGLLECLDACRRSEPVFKTDQKNAQAILKRGCCQS